MCNIFIQKLGHVNNVDKVAAAFTYNDPKMFASILTAFRNMHLILCVNLLPSMECGIVRHQRKPLTWSRLIFWIRKIKVFLKKYLARTYTSVLTMVKVLQYSICFFFAANQYLKIHGIDFLKTARLFKLNNFYIKYL